MILLLIDFVAVPDPIVTGSDVSAVVGSPAVLRCSMSGNSNETTITYRWTRAGVTVATLTMYQVSSVGVSDAGVYTCDVTVSDTESSPHVISGVASVNVTLTVTSKYIYKLLRFTFCTLQVFSHPTLTHFETVNKIEYMRTKLYVLGSVAKTRIQFHAFGM